MKLDLTIPERYGLALRVVEAGRKHYRARSGAEEIAEIGAEIVFDPEVLDTYHFDGWKPIHHDLLVLSASIEYADRRKARRITRWARDFTITVPVVEISTWQQADVQTSLRAALGHLTGDDWQFRFVPWQGRSVLAERQRMLPLGTDRSFVIAYSNGIDSRCVSMIVGDGGGAVRVHVARYRRSENEGDEPFDQIPFKVEVPSSRECSVRTRGFKFAAVTAIAAHLTGLRKIVVPESGQGALGPVLLPLHNMYADYRNHPTFFRKMERFISSVLEHEVRYEQPRLWNTKGETILAFRQATNKKVDVLFKTRSCWQQRWNAKLDGKLRQCGLCAACLLRRMSMHAAGLEEPQDTYVVADLSAPTFEYSVPGGRRMRLSKTMVQYGSVGARHLQQLADMSSLPDDDLKVHAFEIARATGEPRDDALKNLKKMLENHAEEWRAFMAAQGEQSFLRRWTKGGRYDRSE